MPRFTAPMPSQLVQLRPMLCIEPTHAFAVMLAAQRGRSSCLHAIDALGRGTAASP